MPNHRKKGFTATQSKLTSRRLRSATVGTHVPRRSHQGMNGASMGFSSPRKQKRAARGYVDTILPSTSTRESSSQYSRRVSRREFTDEVRRRARVRRIVVAAACLAVALCAAAIVGAATFFGSLDAKMSLGDSDASSALVAAKSGEPFYALVAADLDEAGVAGGVPGPDALALVRVDRTARTATVVSIPATLQVALKDGEPHQLRDAAAEGDASLVSAAASFAGVSVSHLVKVDAAGVMRLVDAVGGVEVDVAEEVDDPTAGDVYLPAGRQQLDGRSALTLLRASNFEGGLERQAANQRSVLSALSVKLFGDGTLGFLALFDGLDGAFKTDVGAADALSLADALRGMDEAAVRGALVPGYETERDGTAFYMASSDAWTAMMELVEAGEDPVVEEQAPLVDPASFTITVRNGSDIAGGAAQLAATLGDRGFDVTETGNTDVYAAYDETLIVYNDDKFEGAAQTVVNALGFGRTVPGSGFYTFETDVLVVLGKDWKPTA
ncbi:LCP family protein [Arabiibacter massiliensis]|uniref:LCP family protein n=1 Tax=Arabiibacter massiliensis TaxID=1870985 RepID=UPI0009BB6C3B|nr:LCP family protein [Arabiibacter massiliensis]